MARYFAPLMVLALLTGCGLAETATHDRCPRRSRGAERQGCQETQAKIEKQLQAAQESARREQLKRESTAASD